MNEEDTAETAKLKARERNIGSHIFTTSAVMLGLCLTITSVMRGKRAPALIDTVVDDIVVADALCFMAACMLSYAALRSRTLPSMHRMESVADTAFLLGLGGMALACSLFAWTIL